MPRYLVDISNENDEHWTYPCDASNEENAIAEAKSEMRKCHNNDTINKFIYNCMEDD